MAETHLKKSNCFIFLLFNWHPYNKRHFAKFYESPNPYSTEAIF